MDKLQFYGCGPAEYAHEHLDLAFFRVHLFHGSVEIIKRTVDHANFLWANPTLACGRLLAQGFSGFGWRMRPDNFTDIGGLPAFIYEHEGDKKMQPCAELLLPERSAEAILQLGIMPVVSFRNRDMARLLRFQSISDPLKALEGPW